MASTIQITQELEDLITCPICLCEYEESSEDHKPKLLFCSHTLCCQCLKGLRHSYFVVCPLCRKTLLPGGTLLDTNCVPTNTYVLYILKIKKSGMLRNYDDQPTFKQMATTPKWCLTCGSTEKTVCATALHSIFDMNPKTMSNFEALVAIREQYAKKKESIQEKLELAAKKENELQKYLETLLKALQSFEEDVKKLQEECNRRQMEIYFWLESRSFKPVSDGHTESNKHEENEVFLAELSSIVKNCSESGDNIDIDLLKKKMEESIEEIGSIYCSSSEISDFPDAVNNTRITVKLSNEPADGGSPIPVPEILENGFVAKWKGLSTSKVGKPVRRDLILLSHLIFSVRKRYEKNMTASATTLSTVLHHPP